MQHCKSSMIIRHTIRLLILTLLLLTSSTYAINLTPTSEGTLLFPVPSVVTPFAFGMNSGQFGGGIGGSYCLSNDIHCKGNYGESLAYGFGNPTHLVNIDTAAIFTANPNSPNSDSLTTHGSLSTKVRHFFPHSKTAIATGVNWMFLNKVQGASSFSHYFTITQLIPSTPKKISGNNFPLSISTGISQGADFNQITCANEANTAQHNSQYYPFLGIGIQFTPKIAFALDDYYHGIINMAITTPLFKSSAKVTLGMLNALAQRPNEQSRAITLIVTL